MEAINLDLLPGAMPPIVHVSQGDVGRQFKIAIYDDTGAAYSLTGKTLSIVGHKGDGNVFQYAIPSSAISGNEVTITTEEQMTPAAGKALCEIRIEQNGTKLGTANFVMDVEQGPADMGALSISALYLIDALFEQAQEDIDAAAEAAATATQKATEAAASAASAAESLSQIGDAVDVATQKANEAASSASSAATSASQAAAAVERVHDDAVAAQNAATAAATSASAASTSASAAATSATSASNYASAADTSADAASDFADAASQSASAASTSANTAATAATNASASESAAATSESNAASSASTASTAATNAAASASQAATSASNAATSESNASASATAAEDAKGAIEDMTVSSQTVPYTSPAEVTKSVVQGVVNLDFKIPRGEPTSGHDVEANPTGAATGDLTKLGIDGTIYNIASGSGGADMLPTFLNASKVKSGATFNSVVEWLTGGSGQADSDFIWIYYYDEATAGKFPLLRTESGQPTKELDVDAKSLQAIGPWSSVDGKIHAATSKIPSNIIYDVYNIYDEYPKIHEIEYYGSNAILYYDSNYNEHPGFVVYGKTTDKWVTDAYLKSHIWEVTAVKAAKGCWKEV